MAAIGSGLGGHVSLLIPLAHAIPNLGIRRRVPVKFGGGQNRNRQGAGISL